MNCNRDSTPADYESVEVSYDAFIACGAVPTPANFFVHDFYEGDLRDFGYTVGSSRQLIIFHVTVDPREPNGQAAGTTTMFSQTRGFNWDPDRINPCIGVAPCPGYCQWCIDANAIPDCALTAVNGQGGNLLQASFVRVSPDLVRVQMDAIGYNPCVPIVPAIDAHITFEFRQLCANGILQPMQWRIVAGSWHDTFPWHELYLNGAEAYRFDPCPTGPDPMNLFDNRGNHVWQTNTAWETVP